MPKLLVINSTLGRGSTGRIAETVAEIAREHGWETFIAHGSRYVGKSDMFSLQIGKRTGELCHYIESRIFDRHGLGSKVATRRLLRIIDEIKPDVVHVHNIHGYYANYEILFNYLAKARIPTVMTIHDFWLMTGHCAYISKNCNRWEIGCGSCPRLKDYPAAMMDRSRKNWALKKSLFDRFEHDKLVFVPVSHWLERYLKQSLIGGYHIQVIQNGVDTTLFKPYEGGAHSERWKAIDWDKYTIITVADRWTEANGFDDIMALSHLLPDDMQVVMVGLNEQQLQGLPEKIIGVTHTDNVQELIELYTSADVLLNASTEVTFGLVTAEAMACGTPSIVLKNTAGEEIVDGETGFVIETIQEIPALVHNCRESAKSFKERCRKRITEHFDSVVQYSKYISLYNDYLKEK